MSEVIKTCESSEAYDEQKCENMLDNLDRKVALDFPFEKNDDGSFTYMRDNVKLDIDVKDGPQLVDIHTLTLQILNLAQQNDKRNYDEKYIIEKDNFFGKTGLLFENGQFDLTEHLSHEWFEKIFWNASEETKEAYANFLTELIDPSTIDYENTVHTEKNNTIIKNLQKHESVISNLFEWKTLSDILNTKLDINQESSIAILKQIIQNPTEAGYINWVDYLKQLTYSEIKFIKEDYHIHPERPISMEYNGGNAVTVIQQWRILWHYRLEDYNDQIILSQTLGMTTAEDYKVNNASVTTTKIK